MSAEESDKPIHPRIQRGLERLAKKTVENGWDVVKVLTVLQKTLTWWGSLTPSQQEAVRAQLRRERNPRVAENRKPRRRLPGSDREA